jgi:hypothetical protein
MSPAVTTPSPCFDPHGVRLVVLDLEQRLLEVEDDVGDVLDHAGQRRELVGAPSTAMCGSRRPERRLGDPARATSGRAEAALGGSHELAVGLAALDLQRAWTDRSRRSGHEHSLLWSVPCVDLPVKAITPDFRAEARFPVLSKELLYKVR